MADAAFQAVEREMAPKLAAFDDEITQNARLFARVEAVYTSPDKAKLVAVLTYHVVAGKVMAADVKTMKAKTVNGQSLDVKVTDGHVTVDNAKVVKTDVAASNGVIHVIDTVVLPK
jgi:uncharacterized surface protein with fasciclin (FAS1) repeats